jgi:hypothetical protein
MKNKIESLSAFLILGLSVFAMAKALIFAVNFFSNVDVQTSAMAFSS